MKRRKVLLAAFSLLLCLMMAIPAWADGEKTSFWGFPGETWTISNPTGEEISIGRESDGTTYVITDAAGNVTERVLNAAWKTPSIPAGGKAIVMNWQKQYAMSLDNRLVLTKDAKPALIQVDLQFFDCAEFTNITDHTADVVVYSSGTTLSYVVFGKDGTVEDLFTQSNGTGGIQDKTVHVPAGGKINVICCTPAWLGATPDSTNYPKGSCLARSENFKLNDNAEPAITFFRLFEGMSRSFRNTSGKPCSIYGNGDYVLYNAAGKVDSVGMIGTGGSYELSVPAGYSIAFSAEGGYWTDGSSSTGSDGRYGVPAYAFKETDLPALEYYTFPKGHILRLDNVSGVTAPISWKNGSSATITVYNSADTQIETKTGSVSVDVPANCYAVINCNSYTVSYRVVSGQFKASHTPAGATVGTYHFELNRGESLILTNNNDTNTNIDVTVLGQVDYKVYKADGSTSYKFGHTNGSIPIPAGAKLHVTGAKGITSIDVAANAKLTITESDNPVAVHQTVTKGETYLYDGVYDVGQPQFVGMRQWENYSKDDIYHTFVGTPDAMQVVAWKESKLRKVDGDYSGTVTLNKGEACEFFVNKTYGETPQIFSSKPCMIIGYPIDSEEEVMIDVRANNIAYSSGTASLVMTALQDGTKIRYPAQFYEAVELDEDPLFYETVKKGEARDFAKSGNIQRALLFGVNAEKRDYNEYSGFAGYDWGRSYSLFFSGTGTPYGMVRATDSDVLVVGLKDMVRCDPVVLRAYDKTFYDKSGAKLDYYDSQGLSAIELECEATVSTPETMDVLLAAYDSDGRMLSCEHKQIKRTDLGPALKIPCSIGTDAKRIVLMVVDKEFKPINLLLDLTW